MTERFKSWALWLSLSALVAWTFLQITGLDISTPLAGLMSLLLPVLVGFGIINDPSIHDKLFGNGEQQWYQSKLMWTSLCALVVYCGDWFFGLKLEGVLYGFMNALLPVLMGLGIVNSPTEKQTEDRLE